MKALFARAALALTIMTAPVAAVAADGEVGITAKVMDVTVETADGPVAISRIQDTDHKITDDYAKTSRKCPPFCIQPMEAAEGVATIGELELLDMLKDKDAVVIDARTVEWHLDGTIPGSVNIPYTEVASRLDELGCKKGADAWDCAGAQAVALYCNGPWCGQSPMAIKAMIREGYPADRIFYYRGGMQAWKLLGLSTMPGSL